MVPAQRHQAHIFVRRRPVAIDDGVRLREPEGSPHPLRLVRKEIDVRAGDLAEHLVDRLLVIGQLAESEPSS